MAETAFTNWNSFSMTNPAVETMGCGSLLRAISSCSRPCASRRVNRESLLAETAGNRLEAMDTHSRAIGVLGADECGEGIDGQRAVCASALYTRSNRLQRLLLLQVVIELPFRGPQQQGRNRRPCSPASAFELRDLRQPARQAGRAPESGPHAAAVRTTGYPKFPPRQSEAIRGACRRWPISRSAHPRAAGHRQGNTKPAQASAAPASGDRPEQPERCRRSPWRWMKSAPAPGWFQTPAAAS